MFLNDVFPVLSPLAIDPAHPFPFIPNTGFALALQLERTSRQAQAAGAAADPAPDRPLRAAAVARRERARFLPLEELLLLHHRHAVSGLQGQPGHCAFRVLRDSDLEVEDEAEDLVREFEVALKRRRRGEVSG